MTPQLRFDRNWRHFGMWSQPVLLALNYGVCQFVFSLASKQHTWLALPYTSTVWLHTLFHQPLDYLSFSKVL